jgi:hypothetical protein
MVCIEAGWPQRAHLCDTLLIPWLQRGHRTSRTLEGIWLALCLKSLTLRRRQFGRVVGGLGVSEPLCLLIIPCALKTFEFCADGLIVAGMLTILSAIVSLVSFRFRRRASLELEVLTLRHQAAVLRRQRPGRPWLRQGDRLLWAWLYRAWPRCLKVMVLVKPAGRIPSCRSDSL